VPSPIINARYDATPIACAKLNIAGHATAISKIRSMNGGAPGYSWRLEG
jgi:hypothetical protein